MKTDWKIGGGASAHVYRHPLLSCMSVFLQCLALVADPKARRRVRWTPQAASTAAVLMSLDAAPRLSCRFAHTFKCLKPDHRGCRRTGQTYNGLIKALERQADTVLPIVKADLREQARRRLERVHPDGSWLLLAVDGSKEDLPRTRDHEDVFGIADNGVNPQAFITAIVEVHTGLPWDWRLGPGRASEKKHLEEMIADLPDDALLLADGAFTGLPIWQKLCTAGRRFLIRVGGNVHVLTDLWPDARTRRQRDRVYIWPQHGRKDHPPLELRLIKVGSGPRAVYLLTNVMDSQRLSRKAAGTIYRKRWGVELFYRTLKRTLGCAKLRSKAGRRARIELEWTLITLTIVTLIGIDALLRRRRNPRQLSPAHLLAVLREGMRSKDPGGRTTLVELHRSLGTCIKDSYQRRSAKSSRHRITTRNTPTLSTQPPVVRTATHKEQQEALKYHSKSAA